MFMKTKNFIAILALCFIPTVGFAQDVNQEALSTNLGHKIDIVKNEIKTLKSKLKLNAEDAQSVTDLTLKESELNKLKSQKKTIDAAIKAEKKSKKETKQAEKAEKKNESASKTAEILKVSLSASEKSNELLSDELSNKIDVCKNELKVLKSQKKLSPDDLTIKSKIASKQTEIKELKRQKKTFDTAIKADKKSKKEAKQAEKALEKHEKAQEKAQKVIGNL